MIEESRFTAEVERMQDMLYRVSVSILRSDADAQDAVQQALENAWRHRRRVNADFFAPWLTRIVINTCKSLLRQKKRLIVTDRMEAFDRTSPPSDPSLRDALERVPYHYRMPLLLHYLEGFSLEEIARMLHLPLNTVKSRLHRGRSLLRAEWNKAEENDHEA